MREEKRLYSLDFIKIFATLLIILHHYQQVQNVRFERGINFFGGRFYFGYLVELFFVLSGFFMYRYTDKIRNGLGFGEFFARRYFRFLPLMAFTAVVSEALMVIFEKLVDMPWKNTPLNLWGTISTALGIQAGWALGNPGINNPTWYISVLLLCFIIFYGIVYAERTFGIPSRYLFIFMILLGMGITMYEIELPFLNSYSARGYYSFFWGILLAGILNKKSAPRSVVIISTAILLGFPVLVACSDEFVQNGIAYTLTYVYYSAVVVVFTSQKISRLFRSRILETLAGISYNVYMWHGPLFILVALYFLAYKTMPDFNSAVTIACYVAGFYLFGTFSYYCIDRPLSKVVNGILNNSKREGQMQ